MHPSWDKLNALLSQEPLTTLFTDILPKMYCLPKRPLTLFEKPINMWKVVIVGTEPSHCSLASNRAFLDRPEALKVIEQEIKRNELPNYKFNPNNWEDQGVLLLNTSLTVEVGRHFGHTSYWDYFISRAIQHLSTNNPCIWVFWGDKTQKFIPYIQNPYPVEKYTEETIDLIPTLYDKNYIIKGVYPSKLEEGFIGNNHFDYINTILTKLKKPRIKW